jgi:flagellar biogenesis protein FliO
METVQQTGAVALVLALLLGTLWWLRRRGIASLAAGLTARRGSARRLEAIERLTLGPQHTLHLVRMDRAALLISASPSGCALIHRTDRSDSENAGAPQ